MLREEVAACPADRYRVHVGMREAIDGARARRGRGGPRDRERAPGARLKLARVGIDEPFAFGGFGCDAEDRVELIRNGAESGAAQLGAPREDCRVVVIGDTPKDVEAAKAIGAACIGVGTGHYTPPPSSPAARRPPSPTSPTRTRQRRCRRRGLTTQSSRACSVCPYAADTP